MNTPTIYILRHAEKPIDQRDSFLSIAGFSRAEALVDWFRTNIGVPDYIFAAQPNKNSQRPYQTVMPLASAFDKLIDMRYENAEYDKLATLICHSPVYENKIVVVCWHHGRIPHLMHELGAKSSEYPKPWNSETFDLVLKLDYKETGESIVEHLIMPF